MRHFNTICFPNPRNSTINRVFIQILNGYLSAFEENIKVQINPIVNASIEFYERILVEKLPTPQKFHYTFNLRDLSKVFMGVTNASQIVITNSLQLVRLWTHEMSRVFYDRMNNKED